MWLLCSWNFFSSAILCGTILDLKAYKYRVGVFGKESLQHHVKAATLGHKW